MVRKCSVEIYSLENFSISKIIELSIKCSRPFFFSIDLIRINSTCSWEKKWKLKNSPKSRKRNKKKKHQWHNKNFNFCSVSQFTAWNWNINAKHNSNNNKQLLHKHEISSLTTKNQKSNLNIVYCWSFSITFTKANKYLDETNGYLLVSTIQFMNAS